MPKRPAHASVLPVPNYYRIRDGYKRIDNAGANTVVTFLTNQTVN